MGAAGPDDWRLLAPSGEPSCAEDPAGEPCRDPGAVVLASAEAAEAARDARPGGPAPGDAGLDDASVVRLARGGREFVVGVRLERAPAAAITAVVCEVADAASGDLLQSAAVHPRIRMSSLATLDPWTRTAVRQTLRRLLAAAAGTDAAAVS